MEKVKQTTEKRKAMLRGKVVSNKMKDTVVVAVSRFVKHPKYAKYVQITKRFKADDKGNTKKVGDEVNIEVCRPISKDKRFRIIN